MNKIFEISFEDIAEFLEHLCQREQIRCIAQECLYSSQISKTGCVISPVYLRKGICRYYKPGEQADRTDLPGGDYLKFIDQKVDPEEGISTDQHNT
jgi:hypothetical protein